MGFMLGSTSPLKDYEWHQGRLRTYLENLTALNIPAEKLAHQLADRTRQFADAAGKWHLIQRIVRGNYRTLCTLHVSDTIDQCKAVAERYELLSRQFSEPLTIDH